MSAVDLEQRRWIGRGIRMGLIALTIIIVLGWMRGKVRRTAITNTHVVMTPPPAQLAPGDMRIVSTNGALELVLQGDHVTAGMSAEKIAEVRAKLEDSRMKDTSGLGGAIASAVKRGVSDLIGAHASYPVSDITDIRYDNGRMILQTRTNGRIQLFEKDRHTPDDLFAPDDAQRFVEAVRARMRAPAGR